MDKIGLALILLRAGDGCPLHKRGCHMALHKMITFLTFRMGGGTVACCWTLGDAARSGHG